MDELATMILEEFEKFLERNDIYIPCKDAKEQEERIYNGEEARLYDTEYYELLEAVQYIIDNYDDIIAERERSERCYECTGYGDDYSVDEDGNLVSNCDKCYWNSFNY